MSDIELVEVQIETSLEAKYVFPDMPRKTIELMLSQNFHGFEQLSLVNPSHAVLVIPTRIVQKVWLDGEEKWSRA